MASPDTHSVDLPLLAFGGKVSQYDPQTLPSGASPFNQDVAFSGITPDGAGLVGGVATRNGTGAGFYAAPFAGNPTVNYLKTFVDPLEVYHLLSLDGLGVMRDESPCPTPSGVPTIIGQVVAASLAQSDSLFGREYIAISSPTHPGFGTDIPRQWDGTNFDRVSQVGPGAPPSANDSSVGVPILGSPNGAIESPALNVQAGSAIGLGYVEVGVPSPSNVFVGDLVDVAGVGAGYNGAAIVVTNVVPLGGNDFIQYYTGASPGLVGVGGTVTTYTAKIITTLPAPVVAGQTATLAGIGVAAYNGVWAVHDIIDPTHFHVTLATNGNAASGGGTVVLMGHISAGLHQVSVSFITRQNYITKPAPFGQWTAAGNLGVVLSNIPTGPSNIIGRIVMFTPVITPPAIGGSFFYFDGDVPTASDGTFPSMVISDNTTTSAIFDFLDSVLQLGTPSSNLFNLLELGECSSVIAYADRLFWAGERNKVSNFNNLTFDGGPPNGVPLGWTADLVNGAGGQVNGGPFILGWQNAYEIDGDGVTAIRGMIFQSASQDYLGVPILTPNIQYSVRVKLGKTNNLVQGNINIDLFSTTSGLIAGGMVVAAGAIPLGGKLTEFTATITPLAGVVFPIPTDLVIRVYSSGTQTNGSSFFIESIELFPTKQPFNNTIIRASYAEDAESYDQITGLLQVGQAINQSIRSMFTLLDNKLYIVTERGLFVTQDDGANEPASWSINTVSPTVGTGSVHGIGNGEGWVVIAYHDGLYIFWGGEPVKISQEIQPDWDTINWQYDQTIYVTVDTQNKRIVVGAPTGASTTPNKEFVCDYSQLANSEGTTAAQDIAAHPQAYYSVYNPTKLVAPGKARKWTIWNISANCSTLALRTDGSFHLLRGNNVGNGKVYDQLPGQLNDDGVAINSQYQTAFLPQPEDEQALSFGTHRKLCKYLTGYASGSGVLNTTIYGSQNQRGLTLSPLTLRNPAPWDFESNVNFVGERFSLLFGTNNATSWFKITKISPNLQRDIISPIRGNY